MYLKVHRDQGKKIVAACDRKLIGRVLQEGTSHMDLDTYRSFYVGDVAGSRELESELREFNSANLVGKKAVDVAVALELASKDSVMYINNVPYIQIYKI
ncbi:DUF424 family protein [Candidatus Micrarchaeota archaeon]|nr:DUF424 family protein [Candidatus Micrarchaeota archaeon]